MCDPVAGWSSGFSKLSLKSDIPSVPSVAESEESVTSEEEVVKEQKIRRVIRKKYQEDNRVFRLPDELLGEQHKTKTGNGDEESALKGPQFNPRLYKQRYDKVIDLLRPYGRRMRKVVDFGCSECQWLNRARIRLPQVKQLVGVDVDRQTLEQKGEDNVDLDSDEEDFYWDRRPQPLNLKLYQGSLIDFDQRIYDIDAAVCIEIVEHLYDDVLSRVPEAIFGKLRPFIAIVTTPNQEFNQLFEIEHGKFRHWDHKFEWTRAQFKQWVESILNEYPEYEVEYDGVGFCEERLDVGPCSQAAIFTMKCGIDAYIKDIQPKKIALANDTSKQDLPYKLMFKLNFPFDPYGNRRERLNKLCSDVLRNHAMWGESENLPVVERYSHKYAVVPLKTLYRTKGIKRLCRGMDDLIVFLMSDGFAVNEEKSGVLQCLDESEPEYSDQEDDYEHEQHIQQDNPCPIHVSTDKGGFTSQA